MSKWLFIFLITFASAQANSAEKLIAAARKQIGVTVRYDPAYASLTYPKGDIPRERGVCTDVLIRALRDALDKDLQELVHLDMKANFAKYPKIWGLKSTDKNIDHRRVPNLMTYFTQKHISIPLSKGDEKPEFLAGDIVTCTVPPNLPHIMIVSDKKNTSGRPLIIHNIGAGTQEEDRIDEFPITGHYRWKE
ncbi:MAG: DUF1287 domain-containing protein [Akkermansiaceae bacterium]